MSTQFIMPGETRSLTIHVSDRVFAGLVERARVAGYTPALYAKLLFEAAYAARCGKGEGDPALEACVAKSFERRPAGVAAPAVRVVHEAVAVPCPVLIPVPIPVPLPIRTEPLAVHISGSQPITEEASEHLATLIGAAVTKFAIAEPGRSPSRARSALNRSIRALAACGNDADEIAAELGCSVADIVEAFGSET